MGLGESATDEELMQQYQNGVDGAFDMLFKRHSSRVYGFLMNRLKNRAQADDVFQATFLKLHQARRLYDPAFPFAPWLFTICKSVMTDDARKRSRILETGDDEAVAAAVSGAAHEANPHISLDSLPVSQREAIGLRYKEELPFEEIARRLKTSPSNVRQLISRGIKALRLTSGQKGEES